MNKTGPFGLWMGMQNTDFAAQLEEVSSCKFIAQAVPKPHSAFESYIVEISPRSG